MKARHLLLRILFASALLAATSLIGTSCRNDDSVPPVPDRTPYLGEWAGPLLAGNLGPRDNIEITVTLGAADNSLNVSVLYLTDGGREDFTAVWNGERRGFEGSFNGLTGLVTLAGSSLGFVQTEPNATLTSTLTDARNKWTGTWTGTLACVTGTADAISWNIQKGAAPTELRLTNGTAAPVPVLLTRGVVAGEFAAGGRTYTFTADHIDFTGRISVDATQKGTTNGCTLGLAK